MTPHSGATPHSGYAPIEKHEFIKGPNNYADLCFERIDEVAWNRILIHQKGCGGLVALHLYEIDSLIADLVTLRKIAQNKFWELQEEK